MINKIFVNLPVKDVQRSIQFFKSLGFEFNPAFTTDKGACLILGEKMVVMLTMEKFFEEITGKKVVDSKKFAEVLFALQLGSREEVDKFARKAISAGATGQRTDDEGFMYQQIFQDLDGHVWEPFWMDPTFKPNAN